MKFLISKLVESGQYTKKIYQMICVSELPLHTRAPYHRQNWEHESCRFFEPESKQLEVIHNLKITPQISSCTVRNQSFIEIEEL